jgi:Uma2 family endonuclease
MALPKESTYTIQDIYNLPEGTRAELIDGQIYYMAPPSLHHQQIISNLNTDIVNYIRKKGGDCQSIPAPFAVFLNATDKTYVEPDISVICDKNKLDEKGCHGAPDWIIEVVSPSSKKMDYFKKLFQYSNAGVREYWIVDEEKNRIMVYHFDSDGEMEEYTFQDKITSGIYEDLEIDFSKL